MSAICVIPARKGSKRIPNKNTREFLGRPIIQYVLDEVHKSELFDTVLVSTDDPLAAGIAARYGCSVLARPANLANDHATTAQVLEHALWHYSEYEIACCVYPTAVFLTAEELQLSHYKLGENPGYQIFAVQPYQTSPYRAMDKEGRMLWSEHRDTRTQDLGTHYHDAGLFYWIEVEPFLRNPVLLDGKMKTVTVRHSIDINTPNDWEDAEMLYRGWNERATERVDG